MKPDATDYLLMDLLQHHGRMTNAELAQRVGLSPAATLERVRKLEQHGYIRGYHARLNAQTLGLGVTVWVEVSLNLHQADAMMAFLDKVQLLPAVVECHNVTGDADYLLKVFAPTITHYHQLVTDQLSRMPGIARLESKVVLGTPKESTILPLNHFPDSDAK